MKVAYYEVFGHAEDVLKFETYDLPKLGSKDVLVKIKASGVNPSDVKIRAGLRGGKLAFPFVIPHSDGSGVIEKIGNKVKNFKVGDRVWIYNAAWKRQLGTAATHCVLPEKLIHKLPDNLSFEEGACLGIPAMTASTALIDLIGKKNKIVLITGGAGSVGNAAVRLAKHIDLTVISTVSSEEKAKIAKEAGSDFILNYKTDDLVTEINNITKSKGVDAVIDVDFGANISWIHKIMKPSSTIYTYASVANQTPTLPFYDLMFKNIRIITIFIYSITESNRRKALRLLDSAIANNHFKPIVGKVFEFEKIVEAHQSAERHNFNGSVVVVIN